MAYEYVVAGRRSFPKQAKEQWSRWMAQGEEDEEEEDEEDDDETWDEGSCSIDQMIVEPGEYFDFVSRRAGFAPTSIVAISPAAFEFSECAANVIAAALDGVYFCDAIPDDGPTAPLAKAEPVSSAAELEARLDTAFAKPAAFFAAILERNLRDRR